MSPVARLQIEHIVPRKHGGDDEEPNLRIACIDCNLAKSSNLTGIDPTTEAIAQLFNPRTQSWDDHFAWQGALLVGKTPTGRATIRVLDINDEERQRVRLAGSR